LRKLEFALAAVLPRSNRDDQIRAMTLLHGFDALNQESVASATPLATSKDAEIACWALAILVKTKTPGSLERVHSFLEENQGNQAPMAIFAIGDDLAQIRDLSTLPDLKTFSSSKYVNIRFAVMEALRGMKSPQGAPILIPLLDDPDRDVQRNAVSVLAYIVGKQGDFANPGGDAFFKNPSHYTDLWKKWWADQGVKP
jgi:HEAT repeat protein